jgi:hypothetical protein
MPKPAKEEKSIPRDAHRLRGRRSEEPLRDLCHADLAREQIGLSPAWGRST